MLTPTLPLSVLVCHASLLNDGVNAPDWEERHVESLAGTGPVRLTSVLIHDAGIGCAVKRCQLACLVKVSVKLSCRHQCLRVVVRRRMDSDLGSAGGFRVVEMLVLVEEKIHGCRCQVHVLRLG